MDKTMKAVERGENVKEKVFTWVVMKHLTKFFETVSSVRSYEKCCPGKTVIICLRTECRVLSSILQP